MAAAFFAEAKRALAGIVERRLTTSHCCPFVTGSTVFSDLPRPLPRSDRRESPFTVALARSVQLRPLARHDFA